MGMVKDNPLGVGLHQFSHEIGNYSSAYKGYRRAQLLRAHAVAESGPQGLLALLFVICTLFRARRASCASNVPPDDPETRALALRVHRHDALHGAGRALRHARRFDGAVMAPYWALCGLLERYIGLKRIAAGETTAAPPREAKLVERFPLAQYIHTTRT